MRIVLDTNVIVSMALFSNDRFRSMLEFIMKNHTLSLSSYVIHELQMVTKRKFPRKQKAVEDFLSDLRFEYVYTPHLMEANLFDIRDINDYPVLYTAVKDGIDILITGDKDFKYIEIDKPVILTPSEFIDIYM